MNTNRWFSFMHAAAMSVFVFWGQDALAQDEKKRDRALRILAVGQEPPWREVIQGGRRVQVAPPLGAVPPGMLQLSNEEGIELGEGVGVRMNQISSVMAVSPGVIPLHAIRDSGFDPKAWCNLRFPNVAAGLAILWRDPAKGNWDAGCKGLFLRDDLGSSGFPAGRVRIVNVSKFSLGLQFGSEKGLLKPGQHIIRTGKSGVFDKVPVELSLKDKSGRWIKVLSQQINQQPEHRTYVVLYTNDGEAPTRPVGAVVLREVARTPGIKKTR